MKQAISEVEVVISEMETNKDHFTDGLGLGSGWKYQTVGFFRFNRLPQSPNPLTGVSNR